MDLAYGNILLRSCTDIDCGISLTTSVQGLTTVSEISHVMRKPTFCICENKGPDQLRSYCKADLRLCFCDRDNTIPLLTKSQISSLKPSVLVQLGLRRTCLETKLLVFLLLGSNVYNRDVNEYSNVRIFAFHTNIRMRFLDSNIRIIF